MPSNLEVDVSELPLDKQFLKASRFLHVYDKYSKVYTRLLDTTFERDDPVERKRWARRGVLSPSMFIEFLHPPLISKRVRLIRNIPSFFHPYGYHFGMSGRSLIISKKAWKKLSELDELTRYGSRLNYDIPRTHSDAIKTLGKIKYELYYFPGIITDDDTLPLSFLRML